MSRFILVAGHGGNPFDPGAIGNGRREADINRDIANRVARDYEGVTLYPQSRNLFVARDWDFFVAGDRVCEVHLNAFGDVSANGTETYTSTNATQAARNHASALHNRLVNIGWRDRSVKVANFQNINVLSSRGVHAVLTEICFITNANDMALYNRSLDAVAKAIADTYGLRRRNSSTPPPPPQQPTPPSAGISNHTQRYRVLANPLNVRASHDTTSRILRTLQRGTEFNATRIATNGQLVNANGRSSRRWIEVNGNGWVSEVWLDRVVSTPPPAPTPPPANNNTRTPRRGTFRFNTTVNIRRQPNRQSPSVGQFNSGNTVNYDSFIVSDGHTWISYIGNSGNRNFVAIRQGNGAIWGTGF